MLYLEKSALKPSNVQYGVPVYYFRIVNACSIKIGIFLFVGRAFEAVLLIFIFKICSQRSWVQIPEFFSGPIYNYSFQ